MDIDGAKALEERLARSGSAKAQPASADIPEDAKPIYRWFAFRTNADGATPASNDRESGPALGPDGLGLPSTS